MDNTINDNDLNPVYEGGFNGKMPENDAIKNMNQSLGLTARRYGATAPDAGSVEAIASKNIDKMGLMEPEDAEEKSGKADFIDQGAAKNRIPASQMIAQAQENKVRELIANQDAIFGKTSPSASARSRLSRQQSIGANLAQTQNVSGQESPFIRQLVSDMGKERFEKLIRDLSKMATKIPAKIARSKRPSDPAAYLQWVSGFSRGKR